MFCVHLLKPIRVREALFQQRLASFIPTILKISLSSCTTTHLNPSTHLQIVSILCYNTCKCICVTIAFALVSPSSVFECVLFATELLWPSNFSCDQKKVYLNVMWCSNHIGIKFWKFCHVINHSLFPPPLFRSYRLFAFWSTTLTSVWVNNILPLFSAAAVVLWPQLALQ